ncbi:uncharacterized protein [Euwallacea fornicatus]|uniref:uncharacterized protein n=1 Tax=Euwallacea fornicatus TaxID=995702 RepID=UPI0033900ACB
MQTSLKILICSLILYFNFVRLNASELMVSLQKNQMRDISAMNPCKNDSDCQSLENAVCIEDYCNCNGSKVCANILELKVTKLGEQCRQSSNCHIEHSVCLNQICQCITGMVPSLNKKECLEESSGNCTKFGNCSQPIATDCPKGFVQNSESTKCLEIPLILQSLCQEDAQCSEQFGNAICINSTSCQCQPSYQYNNISGKCTNLEINCREDKDCLNNEQEEDFNSFSCVMGVCKSCFEDAELCKSHAETAPCLEPSCNGSSANVESGTCNPGRCECPEERQFCVNSAMAETVQIVRHPLQKLTPPKKVKIKRIKKATSPVKEDTNIVKEDTNIVKEDTSPRTEDKKHTEDSVVKISTKPVWHKRSIFVIAMSFTITGLACLGILSIPVCVEMRGYNNCILYFTAVNLCLIALSILWMLKFYEEAMFFLYGVVFTFFFILFLSVTFLVRSYLIEHQIIAPPLNQERIHIRMRPFHGYDGIVMFPYRPTPPPEEPIVVLDEHRASFDSSVTDPEEIDVCVAGPSSRPDGPSSRRDGPSSRPDGPSSRPDGPSSRPDGPSSRPDGPSSRPDGPSSRRNGPNGRRDGPSGRRDGPNSRRDGPSSGPNVPSSRPSGLGSRREGPKNRRDGPSSGSDAPSSRPSGPSSRPSGPSSRRDRPSSRPDELSSRRNVVIPLLHGVGPVTRPDRRSTRPRGPLVRPEPPSDGFRYVRRSLRSNVSESSM